MPEMTLTKSSSDKEVAAWISRCISTRKHEHPDEKQDQSYAVCASMAEKGAHRKILKGE
jgi:hypothetical protein